MKPEFIPQFQADYEHYVYARCECPLPFEYCIKIKKVPGQEEYPFTCECCGVSGTVIVRNGNKED